MTPSYGLSSIYRVSGAVIKVVDAALLPGRIGNRRQDLLKQRVEVVKPDVGVCQQCVERADGTQDRAVHQTSDKRGSGGAQWIVAVLGQGAEIGQPEDRHVADAFCVKRLDAVSDGGHDIGDGRVDLGRRSSRRKIAEVVATGPDHRQRVRAKLEATGHERSDLRAKIRDRVAVLDGAGTAEGEVGATQKTWGEAKLGCPAVTICEMALVSAHQPSG